jgi:SAM-dependent methyltransferase
MPSRAAADGRYFVAMQSDSSPTELEAHFTYRPDADLDASLEMDPSTAQKTAVLIKQAYGLGDAVQVTCVLQHLAKHRPDWSIDVAAGIGKHSAFRGLCRRSLILGRDAIDHGQYRLVFDLGWFECYGVYDDSPCTKVCNCLREEFGIAPELPLLKYRINVRETSLQISRRYLQSITKSEITDPSSEITFPVVAIHYQGNTSDSKKNLSHAAVAELCKELLLHGYTPLILDWDRRSPLPNLRTIFCPGVGPGDLWGNTGTGDAELLAALLSQCALVVGVDSGPLHVAGATETPTLGAWKEHSPVQFFDLCPNVTHLVPTAWRSVPPCQNPVAAQFFQEHYSFLTYGDVDKALIGTTLEMLARNTGRKDSPQHPPNVRAFASAHHVSGPAEPGAEITSMIPSHSNQRTVTGYGRDYYNRQKARGLDLLAYGAWQERYGWWLVESLGLDGRRVLDVGCACGSTLRGLLRAGADMDGIDCSEFLVEQGRRQWPELRDRLYVGNAIDLNFIADGTYDWLHSCVVAEHWKPELLPYILAELRRVLKPGGRFFCAYESDAGRTPNGRNPSAEPAPACLKSTGWWEDQLRQAGWQLDSSEWGARLREHAESYLRDYPWAWFVARKPT